MICGKCNTQGVENQAGGSSFWYCRSCKDEIAPPATPLAKAYGAEGSIEDSIQNNLEQLRKLYEYAGDDLNFNKYTQLKIPGSVTLIERITQEVATEQMNGRDTDICFINRIDYCDFSRQLKCDLVYNKATGLQNAVINTAYGKINLYPCDYLVKGQIALWSHK